MHLQMHLNTEHYSYKIHGTLYKCNHLYCIKVGRLRVSVPVSVVLSPGTSKYSNPISNWISNATIINTFH